MTLIAGTLISLYICAFNTLPEWTKTGEHELFPNDRYITAVGVSELSGSLADDRRLAEADAYRNMAFRLQSVIQSKTRISVTEQQSSFSDNHFFESDYFGYIDIQTNLELRDVRIADRFEDNDSGIFYVLAVLDREATGRRLFREIESVQNEINRTNFDVKGAFDANYHTSVVHGDLFTALNILLRNYEQAIRYNEIIPLIEVVQPAYLVDQPIENPIRNTINTLKSLLQAVEVSVAGGLAQDFVPGRPLSEPLQLHIKTGQEGHYSPSPNIPVTSKIKEGFLVADRVTPTNQAGISSIHVTETGSSASNRYRIQARPDWSAWQPDQNRYHPWNRIFEQYQHKISFELQWIPVNRPLTITVIIPENGEYDSRQVGIRLEEKLHEAGFNVRTLTPSQWLKDEHISSSVSHLLTTPNEAAALDQMKAQWSLNPNEGQTDLELFCAISVRDTGKTRIGSSATADIHFRVYINGESSPVMIHHASASAVAQDTRNAMQRAYRSLAQYELQDFLDKLTTNERIRSN